MMFKKNMLFSLPIYCYTFLFSLRGGSFPHTLKTPGIRYLIISQLVSGQKLSDWE